MASSVRPSRATSRCCTERSQSGATSRTAPSCVSLMRKRSASKPGRLIASHARSPLRRNTGCVSHAGIVGGQVPRRGAAVRRRFVQIEVRRPGFFASRHARAEHHARAVGAEREFLVAAVGLGRHVRVERLAHVDRRAGAAVGVHRRDEQVRARAVAPGVPVPHEQAVEDAARSPCFLPAASSRSRVHFEIGAVREHVHAERDALAARRESEGAHVEWIVGDLHGFAAGQRQAPDLLRAGARREEVDAACRRPPSADACRSTECCVSRRGFASRFVRSSSHRSVRPRLASRSVSRCT